MKKLILLLFVSSLTTLSFAQDSKWSHTEIVIQSRFLQQPDDFTTRYDVGIGTRFNYHFTPRLNLNIGGSLNLGRYGKSNVSESETLYIDFFKGTAVHYMAIEEVAQISAEIPLSLQFQFATLGENRFSILGGVTPQLLLSSLIRGFSFNETTYFSSNITNEEHYFFNDLLFDLGCSIVHPINEQCNILLEFGYEYSMIGVTSGLFLRTGIDF